MNNSTKRRKRRRAKLLLLHPDAVRKHTEKGGRTGMVQAKRTPASRVEASMHRDNPPFSGWGTR